jgi:uncharacterized oxidoreductase
MKRTGNTTLVTGGLSGIGLAPAKAFAALGSQVIVSGCRRALPDQVRADAPRIDAVEMVIEQFNLALEARPIPAA